jgi:3-deoxy-D-manno-octulosonic-acid transferase
VFKLYSIAIFLYGIAIRMASPFSEKARLWIKGRKDWEDGLNQAIQSRQGGKRIWFHCASLGEFEQGRPIIECIRRDYPHLTILLTFFSPEGYEPRKNYPCVDLVSYLPLDTRRNALRFLDIARPDLAIFIKYEYWQNYLREMFRQNIPVFMVSAVFRRNQFFFRFYGRWALQTLKGIRHFFLQNEDSGKILEEFEIRNFSISGDTRIDRVWTAVQEERSFPLVERFLHGKPCLMGGSTWQADERILKQMLDVLPDWKFVVVPHEIDEDNVRRVTDLFGEETVRYTQANEESVTNYRVLVVDTLGMLTHLYRYAQLTFIGSGFGDAIHSILEPAAFGMPIFFGPKYHRFQEAVDLVAQKGVFSIRSAEELEPLLRHFAANEDERKRTGEICRRYIEERKGATQKVLDELKPLLGN